MNKKKTIAVAIVLALILLIGGMLAFYTDTEHTDNVFTLGNEIDIRLHEEWDEAKGQNILPGAEVPKAPSIINEPNSSEAYVFAKVIVPTYYYEDTSSTKHQMFTFTPNDGWIDLSSGGELKGDNYEFVYAYGSGSTLTKLAVDSTTNAVFDKVELDKDLKSDATVPSDIKIRIEAYGIQTANLTNAQGAAVSAPADVYALFGNN